MSGVSAAEPFFLVCKVLWLPDTTVVCPGDGNEYIVANQSSVAVSCRAAILEDVSSRDLPCFLFLSFVLLWPTQVPPALSLSLSLSLSCSSILPRTCFD